MLRQASLFAAGWLTLAAALASPLDGMGSQLFSAHMLQHELLMIVAAPLLVLGRPLGVWVWAFPHGWRRTIGGSTRNGAVRLRIRGGRIALGSLACPGFASAAMPDFAAMTGLIA